MAVSKYDNVVKMTAASDELAFHVRVKCIRWISKAASAGDDLVLVESSIGTTSEEIWISVAAGANWVEESSNGGAGFDFRNGIRISAIDSGTLYLYL